MINREGGWERDRGQVDSKATNITGGQPVESVSEGETDVRGDDTYTI